MTPESPVNYNNQLIICIPASILPYDCRLDTRCFWAWFRKRRGDLSLEFWSVWWKEEEIIQEKGEKSIKVAPLYGTEDKRTRKPKRDAYCIRSAKLIRKGKEIRNITGCEVFDDIVLTWENGKRSTFMSEGYI